MPDLNGREWALAWSRSIVMMVWMGVYTQTFLPPVTRGERRASSNKPE